ncbi:MAG: hypothetical protein K6F53_06455 [Lachnospiraceae bacterium]|nr:hypothetical protein [Lachnospiraceae bacterium]
MAHIKVTSELLLKKEEEFSGYCRRIDASFEVLMKDLESLSEAVLSGAADVVRSRTEEYRGSGKEAVEQLSLQIGKLKEMAASYAAAEKENTEESG